MGLSLLGVKIAVLGGDDRDIVLMQELVDQGAYVKAAGFATKADELVRVELVNKVEDAIAGVDAILLPMPGVDNEGNIRAVFASSKLTLTEKILSQIPPTTPVFIGVAKPFLHEWAKRHKVKLIEIAEQDDIAILNSIPSAEGAIQLAMEKLPITIHGSQSFVLGFGRVAVTLVRMLKGIGAHITAVARKSADIARIEEMGCRAVYFNRLHEVIGEAEIIFNTVPAMVLHEGILKLVRKDVLIIDLASTPGGTDFQASARLGINAILAPGLPGKVAPKTAGKILAKILPQLILQEIANSRLSN